VAAIQPHIDLSQPRDVGGILGGAFRLYWRHFLLFATIAFGVAIPVDLLIYGVAGELLWSNDDFAATLPIGAEIAATVAPVLVLAPLITGGHVRAVMDLAEGRKPSPLAALAAAARRLPALAAAVTLTALGELLGLVLLIAPGIYLWAVWWVAAQAVVAEGLGPLEAMSRSRQLVKGDWWRVFGIALLITVVAGAIVVPLSVPFLAVGAITDSGPLTLVGQMLLDGVIYSFTALTGTLLFFDLRARKGAAPAPAY
jgi:hypothetical protein